MRLIPLTAIATSITAIIAAWSSTATADSIAPSGVSSPSIQDAAATATPIKHLVIVFNENVSFDHYFATYPNAVNPSGEPTFAAKPGTPWVNNLVNANLLTNNPNFTNKANGPAAAEPFRLDRTQATTADQIITTPPSSKPTTEERRIYFPDIRALARKAVPVHSAAPDRSWVTTTATPLRRCGITPSISP